MWECGGHACLLGARRHLGPAGEMLHGLFSNPLATFLGCCWTFLDRQSWLSLAGDW